MTRRDRRVARRLARAALVAAGLVVALAPPAAAHDAPDEGEAAWIMADWMLLSFLVFASAALVCFVIALKRGLLRNLEQAKYHILTIDEPDYYTPSWAAERRPDAADADTARHRGADRR